MLEIERGGTELHCVKHSLWKRLWTCYETLQNERQWVRGCCLVFRLIHYTLKSKALYRTDVLCMWGRPWMILQALL